MEKAFKALCMLVVLVAVASASGFAATYTWVGGNGSGANQTDFTNKNNYATPKPPNGGPTAADIVVIGSTGFSCDIPTGKTLAGLTMNGTDAVNITGSLTVGTLTLTSGMVNGNVSATTISGGSASSYVNGAITMNATASVATLYPVGNNGYSPVTITSGTTGDFTISSASGTPTNAVDGGNVLQRTYSLTTPAVTATVQFGYSDGDVAGTEASYVTGLYSGSQWDPTGSSSENAAGNSNTLTDYAFSAGTSQWTLGTDAALPIEVMSFEAAQSSNNVTLNWSTMTENNILGFFVERRAEGSSSYSTVSTMIAGNPGSLEQHNYSYTDANVATGTYYYRLRQVDANNQASYTSPVKVVVGVLAVNENTPLTFALGQNYPNPFNPTTSIAYTLPEQGIVTLKVFNLVGQEVASLINNAQVEAGQHAVSFNASALSSGIYYYHISVKGVNNTYDSFKKMMLVK